MNINQFAKFHAEIWFFHDAKEYNKLLNSAFKLFSLLDFDKKISLKAAKYVKNSYFSYDLAVKNPSNKEKYFIKVLNNHEKALKTLNQDSFELCAKIHTIWWKRFYFNKNSPLITLLIFMQHLIKFNKINPLPALLCSYYTIRAGLEGHNERNFTMTEKYLIKYWKEIMKNKIKNKVAY